MARVLALVPDLLFGSRVQAALGAAGHEVELIADAARLRQRLAEADSEARGADEGDGGTGGDGEAGGDDAGSGGEGEGGGDGGGAAGRARVLVVDLTDAELDGPKLVASLRASGELAGMRTLGFFSHVDAQARASAERAGFDMAVPRSRMAREAAELVARLSPG